MQINACLFANIVCSFSLFFLSHPFNMGVLGAVAGLEGGGGSSVCVCVYMYMFEPCMSISSTCAFLGVYVCVMRVSSLRARLEAFMAGKAACARGHRHVQCFRLELAPGSSLSVLIKTAERPWIPRSRYVVHSLGSCRSPSGLWTIG